MLSPLLLARSGEAVFNAVWLAGCQPLIVPGPDPEVLDDLLPFADGVLLTAHR